MRKTTSLLTAFGTTLALLACGGDGSTDPGGGGGGGGGDGGDGSAVVVNLQNTAFVAPGGGDDVTVPVGTTVRWENLDAFQHDVASTDVPQGGQAFDSGTMGNGDTYEFTPMLEGTWTYMCQIHPTIMVGATITATADGSGTAGGDSDDPAPGDPGY